jgi:hypothetical protein
MDGVSEGGEMIIVMVKRVRERESDDDVYLFPIYLAIVVLVESAITTGVRLSSLCVLRLCDVLVVAAGLRT